MYWNTLSPDLKEIISTVFESTQFGEFRLGGGSALALQRGHRISDDADFIAGKFFEKSLVTEKALKLFPQATDAHHGAFGVFMRVNGIKLDFLSWNKPFIRQQVVAEQMRFLHIEEIAAMKIFAITQRGEKKDYFDIAELLKTYSLKQLVSFYNERHPGSDAAVIARFLSSYSDIEFQPDPMMLDGSKWTDCKLRLADAVKAFVEE